MIDIVSTDKAAAPGGHYSQAVAAGGLVYLSGILPVPVGATTHAPSPFEVQVDIVLAHVDAILTAANCAREDVIQCRVYVTDIANWPAFDAKYASFFGAHRPARAVVPVPELHHGYGVELELVALASDAAVNKT